MHKYSPLSERYFVENFSLPFSIVRKFIRDSNFRNVFDFVNIWTAHERVCELFHEELYRAFVYRHSYPTNATHDSTELELLFHFSFRCIIDVDGFRQRCGRLSFQFWLISILKSAVLCIELNHIVSRARASSPPYRHLFDSCLSETSQITLERFRKLFK